jgi:hypothetical protein
MNHVVANRYCQHLHESSILFVSTFVSNQGLLVHVNPYGCQGTPRLVRLGLCQASRHYNAFSGAFCDRMHSDHYHLVALLCNITADNDKKYQMHPNSNRPLSRCNFHSGTPANFQNFRRAQPSVFVTSSSTAHNPLATHLITTAEHLLAAKHAQA